MMMLSLKKVQFLSTLDRLPIDTEVEQTHQCHGQVERGDGGGNRH